MSTELAMLEVLGEGFKSYSGKRVRYHEMPALYAPKPKWIRKAALPEDFHCTMREILAAVSAVSQISVLDLRSNRRFMPLVHARYVFMWLARLYTQQSACGIGRFCRRDHSTVIHGLGRVRSSYAFYEGKIEDAKSALAERLEAKG